MGLFDKLSSLFKKPQGLVITDDEPVSVPARVVPPTVVVPPAAPEPVLPPDVDYISDLKKFEGCCTWLYLDTRGLVTTGIGNLVKTPEDAVRIAMLKPDGTLATDGEKRVAWAQVHALPPAKPASFYRKNGPQLVVPMAEVDRLVGTRLRDEFIPGIKKHLPEFDEFPNGPKRGLVDIVYNCGVGGFAKFSHMIASCKKRDWRAAALTCSRSTSRQERNDWTRDQFLSATKG